MNVGTGVTCIQVRPAQGTGERGLRKARLTFGGAEVLAGGREASGPMHVDACHSELVPPAGSYVSQLHPLICGLGGGVTNTENAFTQTVNRVSLKRTAPRHAALTFLCPGAHVWGSCSVMRRAASGQGISRTFEVFNSTHRYFTPRS